MKIEKHVVVGEKYKRTVWFSPGPADKNHSLCVFLDGELYLEKMKALPVIEQSISQALIPEMSFVFVAYESPKARHEDFTCNDEYAQFIANDVFNWARTEAPLINAQKNLVCGLSLSGLCSAFIALKYPQVFSSALSQSGSFWWKKNFFSTLVKGKPQGQSRFWLSVGDRETDKNISHEPTNMLQEFSQIEGFEATVNAFKAEKIALKHRIFSGGHEFGPWKDELPEALHWLSQATSVI